MLADSGVRAVEGGGYITLSVTKPTGWGCPINTNNYNIDRRIHLHFSKSIQNAPGLKLSILLPMDAMQINYNYCTGVHLSACYYVNESFENADEWTFS